MAEPGAVLKELESMGTEQFRNTYKRHGAAEPLFGVSFANLKAIARRVKRDHELALALWESGNTDARSLATMIVDPALVDAKVADAWIGSGTLTYYMLVDLAAAVVARSPVALEKADEWRVSDNEWVGQAGWAIVASLAMNDLKLPDAYFAARLDDIQGGIKTAKNRVRHAMNAALIAIGGARPALKTRALGIARGIGKVVVDHGETGCVTPDAAEYIGKMSARTEAAVGGGPPPVLVPSAARERSSDDEEGDDEDSGSRPRRRGRPPGTGKKPVAKAPEAAGAGKGKPAAAAAAKPGKAAKAAPAPAAGAKKASASAGGGGKTKPPAAGAGKKPAGKPAAKARSSKH